MQALGGRMGTELHALKLSTARSRVEEMIMSDDQATASTSSSGKNDVVLFMKGTALFPQCGFSSRAVAILDHLGVKFETVDVLQDPEIRQGIKDYSDWPTVPAALREGRVRRRLATS